MRSAKALPRGLAGLTMKIVGLIGFFGIFVHFAVAVEPEGASSSGVVSSYDDLRDRKNEIPILWPASPFTVYEGDVLVPHDDFTFMFDTTLQPMHFIQDQLEVLLRSKLTDIQNDFLGRVVKTPYIFHEIGGDLFQNLADGGAEADLEIQLSRKPSDEELDREMVGRRKHFVLALKHILQLQVLEWKRQLERGSKTFELAPSSHSVVNFLQKSQIADELDSQSWRRFIRILSLNLLGGVEEFTFRKWLKHLRLGSDDVTEGVLLAQARRKWQDLRSDTFRIGAIAQAQHEGKLPTGLDLSLSADGSARHHYLNYQPSHSLHSSLAGSTSGFHTLNDYGLWDPAHLNYESVEAGRGGQLDHPQQWQDNIPLGGHPLGYRSHPPGHPWASHQFGRDYYTTSSPMLRGQAERQALCSSYYKFPGNSPDTYSLDGPSSVDRSPSRSSVGRNLENSGWGYHEPFANLHGREDGFQVDPEETEKILKDAERLLSMGPRGVLP